MLSLCCERLFVSLTVLPERIEMEPQKSDGAASRPVLALYLAPCIYVRCYLSY